MPPAAGQGLECHCCRSGPETSKGLQCQTKLSPGPFPSCDAESSLRSHGAPSCGLVSSSCLSDVRSVIPCVSSEKVIPDNVSHGRKRRRDELCHSVLLAQGLDHTDARVRKAMMSGKAESVAKLLNSQSRVHRRDVCTLLDMLPSEPLSWQSDSVGKSFQVGSFVHTKMFAGCGP